MVINFYLHFMCKEFISFSLVASMSTLVSLSACGRKQRIILFKDIKNIKDKDMLRLRMRIFNFQIYLYLYFKDI